MLAHSIEGMFYRRGEGMVAGGVESWQTLVTWHLHGSRETQAGIWVSLTLSAWPPSHSLPLTRPPLLKASQLP